MHCHFRIRILPQGVAAQGALNYWASIEKAICVEADRHRAAVVCLIPER
jgi:hypothetical protein